MYGENLKVYAGVPVRALNSGLFISRGYGRHPDRIIDSYEIIYVRSGELDIYEEDSEYCVGEGQALILYPGLKHGGLKTYPPDLSFFWIHFYLEQEDTNGEILEIPKFTDIARPDVLTETVHRLLEDQEHRIKSPLTFNLHIMQILSEIHYSGISFRYSVRPSVLAEMAEKYIHTNFHGKISTDGIAKAIGCNADYLGRVYRHAYGITLTDAIHSRRLKYACRQLLESTMNIDEIAREAGYGDPGYFRRIFKRQKGVSPLEYRRLCGIVHNINTE